MARPLQYGEPTQRLHNHLPVSFFSDLDLLRQRAGVDAGKALIHAVSEALETGEATTRLIQQREQMREMAGIINKTVEQQATWEAKYAKLLKKYSGLASHWAWFMRRASPAQRRRYLGQMEHIQVQIEETRRQIQAGMGVTT